MYNGNSIWNRLGCRVIHNLIGQINSNQGGFDRKSIKRGEVKEGKSPPPYFFSQFILPPYVLEQFLLPP